MSSASQPTALGKANGGGAGDFGKNRNTFRLMPEIIKAAQTLWPRKTAAELSMRTGVGVRACEYWLARKTEMSAEALAGLLRSEAGLEILEAIIGDARPVWWKQFGKAIELSRLRRAQEEQRLRLERLEREFPL